MPQQLNDPLDSSVDISAEYERAKKKIALSDLSVDGRKSFLLFLLDGSHRFKDKDTGKSIGLNQALQIFIESRGILAFSKTATDPLLWSHYANST